MNKSMQCDASKICIKKVSKGFTLIEILVVIAIIAILATITISSINPSKQFKQARDTARTAHVAAILDGLHQNMVDNGGIITCGANTLALPSTAKVIASTGGIDLGGCLVPDYLPNLPFDPSIQTAHFDSLSDYNTGYSILSDTSGRITVSAVAEGKNSPILVTR